MAIFSLLIICALVEIVCGGPPYIKLITEENGMKKSYKYNVSTDSSLEENYEDPYLHQMVTRCITCHIFLFCASQKQDNPEAKIEQFYPVFEIIFVYRLGFKQKIVKESFKTALSYMKDHEANYIDTCQSEISTCSHLMSL